MFSERESQVEQTYNPRSSMVFNNAMGLLNPSGENNCFLNSTIQVLWHLDVFRRNFRILSGHGCLQDSCIFCALKVIFTQFQFSNHKALPPDALRLALAESFADEHRFQLGQMNDAIECFDTILQRIHFHLAWNEPENVCQVPHCLTHQKFAMFLVEQLVCECGETSEPFLFNQLVYYVSTVAFESYLHAIKISGQRDVSFGHLLFAAKNSGENRPCPSNCGQTAEVRQTLTNLPEVISIGFEWKSEHPRRSQIRKILKSISTEVQPSELVYSVADENWAKKTVVLLVGLVCYVGRHYSTFIFHSKTKTWILFDDDRVREIGPDWETLVELCILSRYQPLLLIYADPNGCLVDTSTAPLKNVSLYDEILRNHSAHGENFSKNLDQEDDKSNARGCCRFSDGDFEDCSNFVEKSSVDLHKDLQSHTTAKFDARTQSLPHNFRRRKAENELECAKKPPLSSSGDGIDSTDDARSLNHDGINDASSSSHSVNVGNNSRPVSHQTNRSVSSDLFTSDTASHESQTSSQDLTNDYASRSRSSLNQDDFASCRDNESLKSAGGSKDDKVYINTNVVQSVQNIQGLIVRQYSQVALDLRTRKDDDSLAGVCKENFRRDFIADSHSNKGNNSSRRKDSTSDESVGESKRNSVEKKMPVRDSGETKPAFDGAYAGKSSVKNRFSSAAVAKSLRLGDSLCPTSKTASASVLSSRNSASVGYKTSSAQAVTRIAPASSVDSDASVDSNAHQEVIFNSHQNSSAESTGFAPSSNIKHCTNSDRYGRKLEENVRSRSRGEIETVHGNFGKGEQDIASWNCENGDRESYSNRDRGAPNRDGTQQSWFDVARRAQLYKDCVQLLKRSDEFVELSCLKLEKGDAVVASMHCHTAQQYLNKAGQHCRFDKNLQAHFNSTSKKLQIVQAEANRYYAHLFGDGSKIEQTYKTIVPVKTSRQQDRLSSAKGNRVEFDENMNNTGENCPIPNQMPLVSDHQSSSYREPVFYVSANKKPAQFGSLKTIDQRVHCVADSKGIPSQLRDVSDSKFHSYPTVNMTCDTNLAQKIVSSPCRSLCGVSARNNSTGDFYRYSKDHRVGDIIEPAYPESSLARYRTSSSRFKSVSSLTDRTNDPANMNSLWTDPVGNEKLGKDSITNQLERLGLLGRERVQRPSWKH